MKTNAFHNNNMEPKDEAVGVDIDRTDSNVDASTLYCIVCHITALACRMKE